VRTNDEKGIAKAKRTQKLQREGELADLAALLKMPEFRRYLWRHMNLTCGLLKSSASANGSIQSQNIGMQDVGRVLWAEVEEVDPLAIPAMMTEHYRALKPEVPEEASED
jgi:hypothetical protein